MMYTFLCCMYMYTCTCVCVCVCVCMYVCACACRNHVRLCKGTCSTVTATWTICRASSLSTRSVLCLRWGLLIFNYFLWRLYTYTILKTSCESLLCAFDTIGIFMWIAVFLSGLNTCFYTSNVDLSDESDQLTILPCKNFSIGHYSQTFQPFFFTFPCS